VQFDKTRRCYYVRTNHIGMKVGDRTKSTKAGAQEPLALPFHVQQAYIPAVFFRMMDRAQTCPLVLSS
jgi:hypothetical protein